MYYFIVNPNSRSGRGRSIWNEIHQQLMLRGRILLGLGGGFEFLGRAGQQAQTLTNLDVLVFQVIRFSIFVFVSLTRR